MHHYVLQPTMPNSEEKTIEFSADNASLALKHFHQEKFLHPVRLWEDGKLLCTLNEQRLGKGEMWTITGFKPT